MRIRLQRGSSGEWLAGWVTHLSRDEARVHLWNFLVMKADEPVVGECYGQGTVARFNGRIIAQAGQDLAIAVHGSISYAPSEETPRIQASGLMGTLRSRMGDAMMQVLDVSPLSLGTMVDMPLDPGDQLAMSLSTEMGPIDAKVTVANCRPDGTSEGFRVGLHIVDMARLDRARWGRLVIERAEA